MNNFSDPVSLFFNIITLIIAVTIHEFSHAYSADRLGDPTPRLQKRLSLNPLVHLDPIGTLMLFIVGFGWGKPVQFDPFNLRNPRRDAAIISLAGPASNILTAIVASIFLRLLTYGSTLGNAPVALFLTLFLGRFIIISLVLAVFNLIPIHPLDGFKIVGGILPPHQAKDWYTLERYGMIFLLLLLLPLFGQSPISYILGPILNAIIPVFIPNLS